MYLRNYQHGLMASRFKNCRSKDVGEESVPSQINKIGTLLLEAYVKPVQFMLLYITESIFVCS